MLAYVVRRVAYGVVTLLGVLLLLFVLFFLLRHAARTWRAGRSARRRRPRCSSSGS